MNVCMSKSGETYLRLNIFNIMKIIAHGSGRPHGWSHIRGRVTYTSSEHQWLIQGERVGIVACEGLNTVDTILALLTFVKPKYTDAMRAQILEKRGYLYSRDQEDVSSVLCLEPVLDLFGHAESEKLKQEIATCKSHVHDRDTF